MIDIALNLGCGNKQFENLEECKCINVDKRKLKGINVIADVEYLPFKESCADYILASDIIEHFPIDKTKAILWGWNRSLKIGGILELRCPNLRAICKKYIDRVHNTKLTSWLLYGGQDYALNFHYVGFDKEWLSSLLEECKFQIISYKEADNNMILKARKIK